MHSWNSHQLELTKGNVMSVYGQGTLTVKPDRVIISIGIKTENAAVILALTENAQRAEQVIQALKSIGIKDDDIDTSSFSIYPKYDYSDGKSTVVGYEVEHIFNITVKDVQKAGSIYETAVSNGANIARGIQFQLTTPDYYYQHALADALRNAQEKATVLARTLGIPFNSIPVKVIEEKIAPVEPLYPPTATVLSEQSGPPIQSQDIIIKATVKAVFEY